MFLFYIFILHIFGILAWKRYEWAFLLTAASLPLYLVRFELLGIPVTLLEGMFLVLFQVWVIRKWKEIFRNETTSQSPPLKGGEALKAYLKKRKKYPFTFGITLFALSSFIGVAVAGFSTAALGIYKAYFIEAILFFVLVFDYLKNPSQLSSRPSDSEWRDPLNNKSSKFKGFLRSLRSVGMTKGLDRNDKIILALATSAIVLSMIALWQKIIGNYWTGGAGELRVTGPYSYPNALALYLGPITTLLFFYMLGLKDKFKLSYFYFLLSTFIISSFALFFSKSDAGIAAVFVSIFIGSLFISKKNAYGLISLAILAMGIIFYVPSLRQEFFWQIELKTFSGEVRKQQWRETWKMLKNDLNFISGCGLSGYQKCIEPYHQEGIFFNAERDTDFQRKIVIFDEKYKAEHWRPVEIYMHPHNIFLNFWTELSVIGLIAVIILLFQYFKFGFSILFGICDLGFGNSAPENIECNKLLIIGLLSTMVEILIHGAVDVPYFKNDLSFLWWLLFAILAFEYIKFKSASYANNK